MKTIFEDITSEVRPLVRELLKIEHDAEGLRRQWDAVPPRAAGVEKLFDPLEKSIARRFRQVVGLPVTEDGIGPVDCREVLSALESVFTSLGVSLDTDRLPQEGQVWTGDMMLYELVAPSADVLDFRGQKARYVLAETKLKMNADGSLRGRSPNDT